MDQSDMTWRLEQLADRLAMPKYQTEFLTGCEAAFLRNRDFIRSGKDWLIKEAIAWADQNNSWVEPVVDEYGVPYDLEKVRND